MMKSTGLSAFIFICTLGSIDAQTFNCGDLLTDVDGNTYPTVEISGQCWMQENLKTTHCSDGTPIALTTDPSLWTSLTEPSFAYYESDINNVDDFGLLYNGYAALEPCGICPSSWTVPSDSLWSDVVDSFGGELIAGGALKDTIDWLSNTGSTNSAGFTGKPGGFRVANGDFDYLGRQARFWSSTMATMQNAWTRVLYFNNTTVGRLNYHHKNGMSIRCVKNLTTGIEENDASLDFNLFPNPVKSTVTINFGVIREASVSIVNNLGQEVYRAPQRNEKFVEIDVNNLKVGIYFVRIEKAGFVALKKLLVFK